MIDLQAKEVLNGFNFFWCCLKFQWKNKKIFGYCWKYLKSDWLTSEGGFEWFFRVFFILLNPFIARKTEKLDVWDASDSTNFKHQ